MQIVRVLITAWNPRQVARKSKYYKVCANTRVHRIKNFKRFRLVNLVIQIRWAFFVSCTFQRNSVLRNKVLENAGNPLMEHDKFDEKLVKIIRTMFFTVNYFKWMRYLKS